MGKPEVYVKNFSQASKLKAYDVVEGHLDYEGDGGLADLPEHLTVHGALRLRGTCLQRLPDYLHVQGDVELEGVATLLSLGNHTYIAGNLDIEGCTNLRYLPDFLQVAGDLFLANSGVQIIPLNLRVGGNIYDFVQ